MHVLQYMEKCDGGKTVVRSEAAERQAARQHELRRQQRVETLLDKLHQEVEKESSGRTFLFVFIVDYTQSSKNTFVMYLQTWYIKYR